MLTQEQINLFADMTGDHQWIHIDAERAADGPFGSTIAHGFLTLALVPLLLADILVVERSAMGVNYGLDRVRGDRSGVLRGGDPVPLLPLSAAQDRIRWRLFAVPMAGKPRKVATGFDQRATSHHHSVGATNLPR